MLFISIRMDYQITSFTEFTLKSEELSALPLPLVLLALRIKIYCLSIVLHITAYAALLGRNYPKKCYHPIALSGMCY